MGNKRTIVRHWTNRPSSAGSLGARPLRRCSVRAAWMNASASPSCRVRGQPRSQSAASRGTLNRALPDCRRLKTRARWSVFKQGGQGYLKCLPSRRLRATQMMSSRARERARRRFLRLRPRPFWKRALRRHLCSCPASPTTVSSLPSSQGRSGWDLETRDWGRQTPLPPQSGTAGRG